MACKWSNREFAQGTKYKDTNGKIQRILHSWWKKRVAKPISNIDRFVNHVCKEHNLEADHWKKKKTLKGGGKLSSIDVVSPQCGKRYEGSGI